MHRFTEWVKLVEAGEMPIGHTHPQDSAGVSNIQGLVDPTTGIDYSKPNPYFNTDTGAITDDAKFRQWNAAKDRLQRQNLATAREQQKNAPPPTPEQVQEEKLMPIVKKLNAMIDQSLDAFVQHGIGDPFAHPGFMRRFRDLVKTHGLSTQESGTVYNWVVDGRPGEPGSKVAYLKMIVADPKRRAAHLVNAEKHRQGRLAWEAAEKKKQEQQQQV